VFGAEDGLRLHRETCCGSFVSAKLIEMIEGLLHSRAHFIPPCGESNLSFSPPKSFHCSLATAVNCKATGYDLGQTRTWSHRDVGVMVVVGDSYNRSWRCGKGRGDPTHATRVRADHGFPTSNADQSHR
jgi:hypothetical protein